MKKWCHFLFVIFLLEVASGCKVNPKPYSAVSFAYDAATARWMLNEKQVGYINIFVKFDYQQSFSSVLGVAANELMADTLVAYCYAGNGMGQMTAYPDKSLNPPFAVSYFVTDSSADTLWKGTTTLVSHGCTEVLLKH